MRNKLLALLLLTSIIACNKKNRENDGYIYIAGSGLVGKWVATEEFVSPGAGGSWMPLPKDKWFTIEFKADSSFTYSANFPKADSLFSQYSLAGSWMNVTSLVNQKNNKWYYAINANDRLELGVFQCVEGCSYGLRRIQ